MSLDPESPTPPELPTLDRVERRVLGTLVEKGLTTPEYYPLTLKALISGCNQKNNRDPVTAYREEDVEDAVQRLMEKELVGEVIGTTGRTMRYRQELGKRFGLGATEIAVLGELLLRGAQAEGDLRARASRMRQIATQADLRELLEGLAQRSPALVLRLSPAQVQRGVRWTHCLAPEAEREAERDETPAPSGPAVASPKPRATDPDLADRIARMEQRIDELERRLSALEG